MCRQIIRGTVREPPQQRGVARFRLENKSFALRRRGRRIEAQYFVDQTKIPIIVQQAPIGGDLGVYANPKSNVLLERRWVGKRVAAVASGAVTRGERR